DNIMQTNQIKKGKKDITGLKILIGAISLTGTFGFWGLIANKPVEAAIPPENPGKDQQQTGISLALNLQPLPTLIPIRDAAKIQNVSLQTAILQPQTMRQVIQPTPGPVVINNKPVFEQITINRGSSGGGGGGSGGGGASSGSSR
ncbi:MAG: hypothetical protein WCG34_13065, partial [Leptolinea sp.]